MVIIRINGIYYIITPSYMFWLSLFQPSLGLNIIYLTLTLNLLTTTIVAPPSNAIKWQMGFNSAFKGLIYQGGSSEDPPWYVIG